MCGSGGAPHAIDEGVAFYAGSLEGEDGTSGGYFLHNLAQKRCGRMGTCDTDGMAAANTAIYREFDQIKADVLAEECDDAATTLTKIVPLMTIPLIQGTVEYAYKADPESAYTCKHAGEDGQDCQKEWAEGWAFASGALPQIAACDAGAADVVRKNLEVTAAGGAEGAQVPDGYMAVKEAVESVYECLGITCGDVGAFDAANSGMEVCKDGELEKGSDAAAGLRASLLAALAAAAFAL